MLTDYAFGLVLRLDEYTSHIDPLRFVEKTKE
jgi:hypothetical protein